MGNPTEDDDALQVFFAKFEKVLALLQTFGNDSKASFSENVTCLLDKALDHVNQLENGGGNRKISPHQKDDIYLAFIRRTSIKCFLDETLKISAAPVIHPPILIFAIKIVAQLTSSEAKFTKFQSECKDIFLKIQQLTETTVVENNEVKHAFLALFLTLSKFKLGQEWIVNSGMLLFAIECLSDKAIFTRKTAREVIIQILPNLGEEQGKEIFERILKPFSQTETTFGNQQLLNDKLEPYVDILENYIEKCLEGKIRNVDSHLKALGMEELFLNLARTINSEKLLNKMCPLLVGFYAKCSAEDLRQQSVCEEKTYKVFQLLLSRGFIRPALTAITQSLFYWSHLSTAADFQYQLMYLMLVPVLLDTEEVKEHFSCYPLYMECMKKMPLGSTSRIEETLKMMLQKNPELNELTAIVVAGFRKTMEKMGKELALKFTRAGIYLMGCLKNPESKRLSQLSFSSQLAIHLTGALCSFIDVYNIRWWESVETICFPIIMTRMVDFNASRNSQVTCAGLQGLRFCIKQFLHPDQALLVNSTADSTLNDAAQVVDRCLVSIHWEVRDSALEVVLEMAQLSQKRYPDFQNLLIRSGLLKASLVAINDTEPYVRASAMSVIAAASPVPTLWEHMNDGFDVVASCFSILQQDGEALARRAAAKALTLASQAGHFPLSCDRSTLYRMMSSAALYDLDWEVKLQALHFWEVIFKETVTNQGMMDGHFPEYIFSQEKQKIIKLNTTEIRQRLQKIVSNLGSCGYLHVLLQSADDCDVPVREKAICLLRDIRDLLAKHQALDLSIWPAVALSQGQLADEITDQPSVQSSNGTARADQVIEEILDQDDLTLVTEIFTKSQPSLSKGDPAMVTNVDPSDFVTQINVMELETMLEWTGFSSDLHALDLDCLVDDLQGCIYTDDSRPHPDCY